MVDKSIAIHDDNCGEVLDRYGYCYRCNLKPNELSVVVVNVPNLLAELRSLRVKVAAMTPVVEAAEKVRDLDGVVADLTTNEPALYDAVADMYDAVDTYRAAKAQNECMDCGAPLIPCTCRPGCPGGMRSTEQRNPRVAKAKEQP